MPQYAPMGEYHLTSTQVDLIIWALNNMPDLSVEEDNERRRIMDELRSVHFIPGPFIPQSEDPYTDLCDH